MPKLWVDLVSVLVLLGLAMAMGGGIRLLAGI